MFLSVASTYHCFGAPDKKGNATEILLFYLSENMISVISLLQEEQEHDK